uniref:Uncharacterized protein n=1 Tax=Pipistrellus kuhlii TaxID=59472 RepID=A0A7J7VBH8_PIPKU|nr:hypothetical protein mPipKuh1_008490 [Pipistrellus kuhlii]
MRNPDLASLARGSSRTILTVLTAIHRISTPHPHSSCVVKDLILHSVSCCHFYVSEAVSSEIICGSCRLSPLAPAHVVATWSPLGTVTHPAQLLMPSSACSWSPVHCPLLPQGWLTCPHVANITIAVESGYLETKADLQNTR